MALGQVAHMQALLAENVRRSIGGLGNRGLQESQFGLEEAQVKHTMGRERAADERQGQMDELALPGLQMQSEIAKNAKAEYNQPIHMSMLTPTLGAVEHFMSINEGGSPKDAMILKFAEMFGGKWDTVEGSPTRGQLLVNGRAVTAGDLHKNKAPIQAFMKARTGLDHAIRSKDEANERDRNQSKITEAEYQKRKAIIGDLKTNIPFKMKIAREHIDFISQFTNTSNPMFQGEMATGLKRWQAKYDKLGAQLEKQQAEERKQAFELEKIKAKAEGKDDKYSNKLNKLKYEAQAAYLDGTATPEQIRMYQLDKDVYLAQATKIVNDDFASMDLTPEQKIKKIIEYADEMRRAARNDTEQADEIDPLGIR